MEKQKLTATHVKIVIGLCLLQFGMAIGFTAMGVFYDPVCEYLGVGRGELAIYYTLQFVGMFTTLAIASRIYIRVNLKVILSLAMAANAGALFIMSNATALWQWYVAGIIFGIGGSYLFYIAPADLINNWFKNKAGTFLAIASCFTGVAGIVMPPIATGLITGDAGWRGAYLVYAIVAAVAGFAGILIFLTRRPSEKGLRRYGETQADVDAMKSKDGKQIILPGLPAKKATKSASFIWIMLACMCIGLMAGGVLSFIPGYITSLGFAAMVGALISSAASFGNLGGKFLMGALVDVKDMLGVFAGLGCGCVGLLILVYGGAAGMGEGGLAAGGVIFGVVLAGIAILNPVLVRNSYGSRDYAIIFSYTSTMCALCSAFGATIFGFLIDAIGYQPAFTIAAGISAIGILFAYIGLKKGKKLTKTYMESAKIEEAQEDGETASQQPVVD